VAYSLEFNSVDLADYGLVVLNEGLPVNFEASSVQLENRGYSWNSVKVPRIITLDVAVVAASLTTLKSYLDSIKENLNYYNAQELKLDIFSGRYWNAKFQSFTGRIISPTYYSGQLVFKADDPAAFSTTETTSGPTNVDADPKSIYITPGGSASIRPVYTLTAGAQITTATIKMKNDNTSEEIEWGGGSETIDNGEVLTIDCENWIVNLEGTADMDTVDGQFPVLVPNTTNEIIVTGFGAAGTLTTVYRDRYI